MPFIFRNCSKITRSASIQTDLGTILFPCGDTVRTKAKNLLLHNQSVTEFQPNFALIGARCPNCSTEHNNAALMSDRCRIDIRCPPTNFAWKESVDHYTGNRFGEHCRGRQTTSNCCLSRRFSAMMPVIPPGPSSLAKIVSR